MKTLVTGAGGYMAAKLVQILAENGTQVRALYRNKYNPTLHHKNIEWVQGDLTDYSFLPSLVSGCSEVYHTAAHANNWAKKPAIFYENNVAATLNLAEAAFANGVLKMVFTSSAGVFGPSLDGFPVNENTLRATPFFGDYEKSKAEAEKALLKCVAEKNYNIVIVNPTRIYGPGLRGKSNSVTQIIAHYINKKWKIRLGSGQEIANYVYVDDVAYGHILAMKNGRAGARYLLGGEDVTFNHFIDIMADISGIHQKLISVPFGVLASYTQIEDFLAKYFSIPPKITHNWVLKLQSNWSTDIKKAQTELGYSPRDVKTGVAQTIAWLKNEQNAI